jgi:protein BUR2
VEENPRKLPDLIIATARFTQRNPELEIDEQSKEYWRWRDVILYMEEQLLEGLSFDFDVMHPYDYYIKLVHRFAPGNAAVGKCGWAFLNDRLAVGGWG